MNRMDLTSTNHGGNNKFEQGQRYRVLIDYNTEELFDLNENIEENNTIYTIYIYIKELQHERN